MDIFHKSNDFGYNLPNWLESFFFCLFKLYITFSEVGGGVN